MLLLIKLVLKLLRKYKPRKHGWFNTSLSWQEAKNQCSGYDDIAIIEKIKFSTLKVKNGEAVFERDGIIYEEIYYSWPLLSQLLVIASQNKGELNLIDFGGSLGTTFFQNSLYLQQLKKVSWSVVEQENFVSVGQKLVAGNGLDFYYRVEDAFQNKGDHQALLLSCVLPYIEKPYELIDYLMSFSFEYIILESTFYNYEKGEKICIQKVDPKAYRASYPCWLLDYEKIKTAFSNHYDIFTEYFNNIHFYIEGEKVEYRSVVFNRKKLS